MKWPILSALVAGLLAVADGASNRAPDNQSQSEAQELRLLVEQSGCLKCHAVDKKVIGPAFRDVAARYRNDARARETLRDKVKKGGKDNWTEVTGGVLMPPHAGLLPDSLIAQLVDWVLSAKE
jgi:cytochrome c